MLFNDKVTNNSDSFSLIKNTVIKYIVAQNYNKCCSRLKLKRYKNNLEKCFIVLILIKWYTE